MTTSTSARARAFPVRAITYWTATALVVAELVVGGLWDVARLPFVRDTVTHLGYPTYFLVLLGVWKLLGAAALLAPRTALVKEWAYAGIVFVDTGAIVSHLTVGYARGEVAVLAALAILTAVSWASRSPDRRIPRANPV